MKTPTPAKKLVKRLGSGEYKPDTEYKRIEDLPKAKVIRENRNKTDWRIVRSKFSHLLI